MSGIWSILTEAFIQSDLQLKQNAIFEQFKVKHVWKLWAQTLATWWNKNNQRGTIVENALISLLRAPITTATLDNYNK